MVTCQDFAHDSKLLYCLTGCRMDFRLYSDLIVPEVRSQRGLLPNVLMWLHSDCVDNSKVFEQCSECRAFSAAIIVFGIACLVASCQRVYLPSPDGSIESEIAEIVVDAILVGQTLTSLR